MLTIDGFSQVVHAIYTTAVGARPWESTLDEIATAVEGQQCLLMTTGRHNAIAHQSARSDPGCFASYNQYYGQLDPAPAAIEDVPTGQVAAFQQLFPADALRGSEFYNDWGVPNGHGDCTFSVLTRRGADASWLSVTAEARADPFSTPQRMTVLSALVPHLQHAIALRSRLSDTDRHCEELTAAVDAASDAMAIVRDDGLLSYLNPAADAMFSGGNGLYATGGTLRASVAAVDRALADAVSAAVGRAGVPTAGRVTVPRPGRRPYVVRVAPVSATGTPAALVIVVDPDRNPLPTVEALSRRYGLTRTEAEVARRVLDGDGLGPIARERSVSITTIRTHMKHIFEKTGTRRQAELVRLILGAATTS